MSYDNTIINPHETYRKLLIIKDTAVDQSVFDLSVNSDGRADITVLVLPGVSYNAEFNINLDGPGASCRLAGIYLCPDAENVVIRIDMNHKVPHCNSTQSFKGIVSGASKVDFYGKIIVSPDAQQTEAYQENHSLLLSDKAKVFTKPQLEIYADDVKCSHGATIGKLNEEEQFYMRSRGISEDEAKVLQMISFLSPIIDGVENEAEREELRSEVENAIRTCF